eukprot:1145254-Prymnesium_polylepis.1
MDRCFTEPQSRLAVGLKGSAQSIVVDDCRPKWRPGGPRASAGAVSRPSCVRTLVARFHYA